MNKQSPSPQLDVVFLQEMPTGGGSDITLKKNITDLPFTANDIAALRPVVWNWQDESVGARPEYGFIAQEVEKVLPHLVYTDTWVDGTERKFLSTRALLPYLVAAVQELQAEIDSLRAEIHTQRAEADVAKQ